MTETSQRKKRLHLHELVAWFKDAF